MCIIYAWYSNTYTNYTGTTIAVCANATSLVAYPIRLLFWILSWLKMSVKFCTFTIADNVEAIPNSIPAAVGGTLAGLLVPAVVAAAVVVIVVLGCRRIGKGWVLTVKWEGVRWYTAWDSVVEWNHCLYTMHGCCVAYWRHIHDSILQLKHRPQSENRSVEHLLCLSPSNFYSYVHTYVGHKQTICFRGTDCEYLSKVH